MPECKSYRLTCSLKITAKLYSFFSRNMRYFILSIFILTICNSGCISLKSTSNSTPFKVVLWESNNIGALVPERILPPNENNVRRITDVKEPFLTVFPAKGKGQKPAVLVFPGGGYSILAHDLEGTEIAHWLNTLGITAIVVTYTVPKDREAAFKDGLRAVKLTKQHAQEWNINPDNIGVIGFSAGAHLSARLSSGNLPTLATSSDSINSEINFTILIYPAYLNEANSNQLSSEFRITEAISPTFIFQTKDDINYVNGTVLYHAALEEAGIGVTFHLLENGGHGYGLRADSNTEVSKWPIMVEEWLRDRGII